MLPGKLTNVEEKFKKPEVQKMAPVVNKIQIPTFEKQPDSDEVRWLKYKWLYAYGWGVFSWRDTSLSIFSKQFLEILENKFI